MTEKLPQNVMNFISQAAVWTGKFHEDSFSQELFCNCLEIGLQSPIEQLFWIAVKAMVPAHFIDLNPDPEMNALGNPVDAHGIYVQVQRQIGSYRVDFLISQHGIGPDEHLGPVVVELDGHDFHDKDKIQRSYEKKRDRYLTKAGYRVVHFTGSDVVADPFAVAHEVLEMVGLFIGEDSQYNKADPLGLGY